MQDNADPIQQNTQFPAPQAIILAAGKGTRMNGESAKVVLPVADRPMIWRIVVACQEAGISRCIIVVGYRAHEVKQVLADETGCVFVEQHEQLGTGHAVRMTQSLFENDKLSDLLVLPGDAPLITPNTLLRLLKVHRQSKAAATVATANLDNPFGYGRVIRDTNGVFQAIVEHKDATESEKRVQEINTGYYCFRSDQLFAKLGAVSDTNAQGEYYLTDVPGLLRASGQKVTLLDAVAPEEIMGVNDEAQLAEVDQILRARLEKNRSTRHPAEESE